MLSTFSPKFIVLQREAGISAQLLASGATILGKASATQHGLYNQAFFNLSIGFERAAKLVFIIDYAIEHAGQFPSDAVLRSFGHGILQLLQQANSVSQRRRNGAEHSVLPATSIHLGIIQTLDDFARSTRYYNLDFLAQGAHASLADPLEAWFNNVGQPILHMYYRPQNRANDQELAMRLQSDMGDFTLIRNQTETGHEINSVEASFMHARQTKVIQKYGQFYTLQIIRFFAFLFSDLGFIAQQRRMPDIPYMGDFFRIFYNQDSYLKRRSTWVII